MKRTQTKVTTTFTSSSYIISFVDFSSNLYIGTWSFMTKSCLLKENKAGEIRQLLIWILHFIGKHISGIKVSLWAAIFFQFPGQNSTIHGLWVILRMTE